MGPFWDEAHGPAGNVRQIWAESAHKAERRGFQILHKHPSQSVGVGDSGVLQDSLLDPCCRLCAPPALADSLHRIPVSLRDWFCTGIKDMVDALTPFLRCLTVETMRGMKLMRAPNSEKVQVCLVYF